MAAGLLMGTDSVIRSRVVWNASTASQANPCMAGWQEPRGREGRFHIQSLPRWEGSRLTHLLLGGWVGPCAGPLGRSVLVSAAGTEAALVRGGHLLSWAQLLPRGEDLLEHCPSGLPWTGAGGLQVPTFRRSQRIRQNRPQTGSELSLAVSRSQEFSMRS